MFLELLDVKIYSYIKDTLDYKMANIRNIRFLARTVIVENGNVDAAHQNLER